jgi:hypothetical protein
MNTTIAFPAAKPELKLPSHSSHPLPLEERRRMDADIEALRLREANLRDYEARLRAWQEQIDANPSPGGPAAPATAGRMPVEGDPVLKSAWDKLIRARELLEAEQAHLRDDRLNLKEAMAVLKRREEALALRDARVTQREEELHAALEASMAEQGKSSALARFTQAPFAMAKSVFSSKPRPQ